MPKNAKNINVVVMAGFLLNRVLRVARIRFKRNKPINNPP